MCGEIARIAVVFFLGLVAYIVIVTSANHASKKSLFINYLTLQFKVQEGLKISGGSSKTLICGLSLASKYTEQSWFQRNGLWFASSWLPLVIDQSEIIQLHLLYILCVQKQILWFNTCHCT